MSKRLDIWSKTIQFFGRLESENPGKKMRSVRGGSLLELDF